MKDLHAIRGATCYLNSLIQALYMTPELRTAVFSLSEEDLLKPAEAVAAPVENGDSTEPTEPEKPDPYKGLSNKMRECVAELLSMGFDEARVGTQSYNCT